ncbi:mediator of rna polymerase ii transcription subunit 25, partial [Quercus suber]
YEFTLPAKNVTIILNLFVGLPQDQNNSPAGNIPTETSTVLLTCFMFSPLSLSWDLQPAVSQDWCVPPHDFSTSIPISGQTSSLSYSFKEEITEEEIMRALSPEKFTLSQNTSTTNPTSVCGGTPPEIMTSAADAGENSGGHSIMSTVKENPHDDTSVFDWRSLLRATQSTESTSKHLCSITSASGNLNNSKPAELGSTSTKEQGPFKSNEPQGVTSQALAGTSESLQSTTDSSFMSSSFISGISQPEILQATYAGIHSPHFSMLSPMAKSEALLGTSQTTQTSASSFTSNTSKLSGNLRTMQPLASLRRTIGNNRLQSKKRQRGQLGVSSHRGRSVSIVERSQHISGGTEISAAIDLEHNYVMAWEGDISAKKKDKVIIVRRLKAYQKKSAPETLTADWPQTLQIVREIPQRLINKTIDLPSQTLIFTPTGAPCRFIGTLFPGDCPLYKSCEQEQNDQATADESAMNETD